VDASSAEEANVCKMCDPDVGLDDSLDHLRELIGGSRFVIQSVGGSRCRAESLVLPGETLDSGSCFMEAVEVERPADRALQGWLRVDAGVGRRCRAALVGRSRLGVRGQPPAEVTTNAPACRRTADRGVRRERRYFTS
jgi:hypothetical protein